MLETTGFPKTHCQSFAKAALPRNASLMHCHQNEKNRRITTILALTPHIRQADNAYCFQRTPPSVIVYAVPEFI